MPYPSTHSPQVRLKILAAAYQLFVSQGFEATSIDQVMQACGLTRGTFYRHFQDKGALYRESIEHAASQSSLRQDHLQESGDRHAWIRTQLADYLRKQSPQERPWPCPLAFFTTDIAHQAPDVRAAYTRAFESMSDHLTLLGARSGKVSASDAMAITALLIGSVAIARTLTDPALRERLVDATERHVLEVLRLEALTELGARPVDAGG
jgi:TetR/AcrR family transcriptional regulator, transcriptional repressor for nem operon